MFLERTATANDKILIPIQFFFTDQPITSNAYLPLGVVSVLNVTVRSEARSDPGRNRSNGLASIWVNKRNYAPQTKGYNVAVFDPLSGEFV